MGVRPCIESTCTKLESTETSEGKPSIRLADFPVSIQTSPELVPSTPCWFGEVAVIASYLEHLGVLAAISERVRFARRRFGGTGQSETT